MKHDDYADAYRRNRFALPWILEPLATAVARLPAEAAVVEVGCGTGNYSIALSETRPDVRYFGFDISQPMLAQARQRLSSVEFAEGDANARFPYPDDFAHLSFCVDVLHHLTDHAKMFRELARILQRGCSFMAVTDSSTDIDERSLTRFFPETRTIELSRYPNLDSLTNLAQQALFSLTERLPLRAEREIDAELLRQLREKSASALRLIDDTAHTQGMQRATLASHAGARWLSCYTLLHFVR
jgi:ubiquinone/menaquinone biosynthesis C-methylase UbiE